MGHFESTFVKVHQALKVTPPKKADLPDSIWDSDDRML
jgi:hypothetical protein